MRDVPTDRDEIDALLGDEIIDDDLSVLAAVVHDIRSEYWTQEPLRRSGGLLAFTEPQVLPELTLVAAPVEPLPSARRVGRRGLQAAGIGLAGKVLLGTTLAAASVGGLGATGVVELPGLPDSAADQAVEVRPAAAPPDPIPAPVADADAAEVDVDEETSDDDDSPAAEDAGPPADPPGAAVSVAAHMKQLQTAEFVAANDTWHECADELPVTQREDVCGERPHPSDFGVTDPPGRRWPSRRATRARCLPVEPTLRHRRTSRLTDP